MSNKIVLLICVQTALFQMIIGQCGGSPFNNMFAPGLAQEGMGWGGPGFGFGSPFGAPAAPGPMIAPEWTPLSHATLPSSNGGGFIVSSSSPIPPMGVSVISDNEYTGPLAVGGQLPFLGTVEMEGALPTTGSGVISYGCGNGNVGMISEDVLPTAEMGYANGLPSGFGYGPGFFGPNYGAPPTGFSLNNFNRCDTV
ncbi:chorion class B protein PC10-like [Battus philenor]|uniref:chorion class B protein PC10-like n=1 Tax=Battus philenor TaxID=42288 RepID=UPI0035D0DC88